MRFDPGYFIGRDRVVPVESTSSRPSLSLIVESDAKVASSRTKMGAPQRLIAGASTSLCIAALGALRAAVDFPSTPPPAPDGISIVGSGIETGPDPSYANMTALITAAAAANASITSSKDASLPVSSPVTLAGNFTTGNSTINGGGKIKIDITCLPQVEGYTYPADLRDCWHVLKTVTETPGWPLTEYIKFTTSQKELVFLVPHRWGPDEGPKRSCKVEIVEDMELMRIVDDEFSLKLLNQYAGQMTKNCVKENPTGDGPYGGSALIGDNQVFWVNVLGGPTASTALPSATGVVVAEPGLTS